MNQKDLFSKINQESINKYQSYLVNDLKLSPATIKRRFSSIRKFCEWATHQDYLEQNPFKITSQEKKQTIIPAQKSQNILSKAYKAYHNIPATKYFHYAILIVFCAAVGFGFYDQFFKKAPSPLAYPTSPISPNRYLSFQGRLTDSSNNPISVPTDITFKLWNIVSGGDEGTCTGDAGEECLWNSQSCTIEPDQDGIFSLLLGTTSGPGYTCSSAIEIPEDVFTKYYDIWLGIEVESDGEMDPRMQIATVGYALSAETLQGLPPGTGPGNIPYIDSTGKLVIGAASPTIQATSGTFALEGQTGVTIQAASGQDGSITLSPKGTGTVNLTSEATTGNLLNNQGGVNFGTVGGKEANNLYYGYVGLDTTNFNLLKLESGETPTAKFTVDASGNASAAGILKAMTTGSYFTGDITVSGGDITGANSVVLDIGEADSNYITSSVGFAVGGSNTYYINSSGTGNLNALTLAGDLIVDTSDLFVNASENKVGIGTTSPTERLTVAGNATISGTLALGPQTLDYAGTCDASNAGKMYYDGDANKYYFCNGTSWTEMGASAASYWALSGNNLYPISTDYNVGIGTSTPNNKFSVVGSADVSGNLGVGTTGPIAKFEVSGTNTGKALAIFNETGTNDILNASSAGILKARINNEGYLDVLANYTDSSNYEKGQFGYQSSTMTNESFTFDSEDESDYLLEDLAYAVTLTPSATTGNITLTLGSGNWNTNSKIQAGMKITGNGGVAKITEAPTASSVIGATVTTPFIDTSAIASGSWHLYGTEFKDLASTVLSDFQGKKRFSEYSAGPVQGESPIIQIDTNKFLIAFSKGDDYHGVAIVASVSGTDISYGSEYVFETNEIDYDDNYHQIALAKLDTNKVLITYLEQGNYGWNDKAYAIVASISGTTISYGTPTIFPEGDEYTYESISAAQLNTDKAIVTYSYGSEGGDSYAAVASVSGTTISWGSSEIFYDGWAQNEGSSVVQLDTDKAFIAWDDWGISSGYGIVASVSGTTITYGSESMFSSGETQFITTAKLDTDKVLIAYWDSDDSYGNAIVASVSGTTISYGSESSFETDAPALFISATQLGTDKAVVSYLDLGDGYGNSRVASISGTTISSWGTENNFNINGPSYLFTAYLTTDKAIVSFVDDNGYGQTLVASASGTDLSYGSEFYFHPSSAVADVSVAQIDTNKVLITYQDLTDSSYGKAVVASISDNTISYGVGSTFNGAPTSYIAAAPLTTDKAIIGYYDDGDEYGNAIVASVSGTTISWGAESTFNAAYSNYISTAQLDTDKAIIGYYDDGDGYGNAIVASVSGTNISWGAESTFNSDDVEYVKTAPLATDKAIIAYYDYGDGYGNAIVASVSGTNISWGAESTFNTAYSSNISTAQLDTDKAIIAYYDEGDGYGNAIIASVSGTTINYGIEAVFNTNGDEIDDVSVAGIDTDKALIAYSNLDPGEYGTAIVASVSGTTISFGDESIFNPYETEYIFAAKLDTDKAFVAFDQDGGSGDGFVLSISGTSISDTEDLYPLNNYYLLTTSDTNHLLVNSWSQFNSITVTEVLNSQTINYSISFDDRTTWKIYDTTGGDAGWRPIARDNSGTWEYNSNSTPGATDITWTSATTNTQFGALDQAFQVAANQMTGTEFNALTDSQWQETGGFVLGTTQTLDFGFGLKSTVSYQSPSLEQITIDYEDTKGILTFASLAAGSGVLKPMQFLMGSTVALYIDTVGNVGVGTTNPQEKLDVAGSAIIGTGSSLDTLTLNKSGTATITNQGYDSSKLLFKGSGYNDGWETNVVEGDEVLYSEYVGEENSLQLDASGYPVISYFDRNNDALKVVHCNDTVCNGDDETINTIDSGSLFQHTSLQLDTDGYPVISYYDYDLGVLKLAYCDDVDCDSSSVNIVDDNGDVGDYSSLQFDSDGYPVISYFDASSNGYLKVAHCNDPYCSGDDENINTADNSIGAVGRNTSLQLDGDGYPVISYTDGMNEALKVTHCNDANCAGSDENINTVVSGSVYYDGNTSLQLDSSGYPIVAYYDSNNGSLQLAHCNDANCAGSDENINTVEDSQAGEDFSLQLDTSGYPVIAYSTGSIIDEDIITYLKIAHCNDVDCAGGDETKTTVDGGTEGIISGYGISLQLDNNDYPVISYGNAIGEVGFSLRLSRQISEAQTLDVNFAFQNVVTDYSTYRLALTNNSGVELFNVGSNGYVGIGTSTPSSNLDVAGTVNLRGAYGLTGLYVNSSGNVGIGTQTPTNQLSVSGNTDITGDVDITGDTDIVGVATVSDSLGIGTTNPSAELDVAGNVIIGDGESVNTLTLNKEGSATDVDQGESSSQLIFKGSGYGLMPVWFTNVGDTSPGQYTSIQLDIDSYPVVSYYDATNGDLKLLHCNDINCSGGDESINTVDSTGDVGQYTSLQLDGSGYPVISYYDVTNTALKLVHCNDANCSGGDETINTIESSNYVGKYTSLQLDSSGYPVISYLYSSSNDTLWYASGDLKLAHCNDANCSGGDETLTLVLNTISYTVGKYNSLQLDSSGYPVISYFNGNSNTLGLIHCSNANCTSKVENNITIAVIENTSLQLDSSGYPVISYYESYNYTDFYTYQLKLAYCNDVNCSGGDETISIVDSDNDVGKYNSLQLNDFGYPVISYYDNTNGNLKIAECNDTNCAGSDETITIVDSTGSVGDFTSLQLDEDDYPVVSYYDNTNGDLKIARFETANNTDDVNFTFQNIVNTFATYRMALMNNDGSEIFNVSSSGNVGIGTTGSTGVGNTALDFKLQVAGNVGPDENDLYDLGSDAKRWANLYLAGDTLHIGTNTSDEGTLAYDTNNNNLLINSTGNVILQSSSGNVGIGTTNPLMALDIAGNATISGTLSLAPQTQAYAGECNAASEGKMYYDADAGKYYYCNGTSWGAVSSGVGGSIDGSGTANFLTRWQDSDTLTNSILYEIGNNIGVGTTNPQASLDVAGTAWLRGSTADDGLYVDSSGYVGIGTINPNNLFQVANLINFDDTNASLFLGTGVGVGTTAGYNTAIGYNAFQNNTEGYNNTAIGVNALENNTTGNNNTALGLSSLRANTEGYGNTGLGSGTLSLNTEGANNTAIGSSALWQNTLGSMNIAIGAASLYANTEGSNNVAIGYSSGFSNETGTGNIFLGYSAGYFETGSDKLYIDNSNTTTPLVWGDFNSDFLTIYGSLGIGTTNPLMALDIAGNATLSGTLSLAPQTQAYAGTCNAASAGKMYYDAAAGKYYYCNGSSWGAVSIDGSGTANFLTKWSDSDTLTNSILYEAGGKIGIGTTDPQTKLDIAGTINIGETGPIIFLTNNPDDSSYILNGDSENITKTTFIGNLSDDKSDMIMGSVDYSSGAFWGMRRISGYSGEIGLSWDWGSDQNNMLSEGGTGLDINDGDIVFYTYGETSMEFNDGDYLDMPVNNIESISVNCSDSGGSLTAGTYYFKVLPVAENDTATYYDNEKSCEVTTGSSGSTSISWSAIHGAVYYKVYKGTTSDGQDRYFTTTDTSFTYTTDTNALSGTPSGGTSGGIRLSRSSSYDSYINTGNFGIGTISPEERLTVEGNFSIYNSSRLGSEKVTNGTFDTSSSWTWGSGWSHDAVNLEADHGSGTSYLEQDVGAMTGEIYEVQFTIKNSTSLYSVTPYLGGTAGNSQFGNGTYNQQIRATNTDNLQFRPSNSFNGSIDDVSVKRIMGGDIKLAGLLTGGGDSGLMVDINGNVGIGNTNPSTFKLQVTGNVGPDANDTYDLGSDALRWANLYLAGDTLHLGTNTSDEGTLAYDTNNNNLVINSTGNTILQSSSGNVGVGTTDPQSELEIAGTAQMTGLKLTNGAQAGYVLSSDETGVGTWTDVSSTAGPWTLVGNNLYPDSTSYNVGIGITSPTSKLEINGTNTGKPLVSLNETGTNDILTASVSGKLKLSIDNDGYLGIYAHHTDPNNYERAKLGYETGISNYDFDFNTADESDFSQENLAYSTTLTPSATTGDITLTLGTGNWNTNSKIKQGSRVIGNSGVATIMDVPSASSVINAHVDTAFANTNAIASGDWQLYATKLNSLEQLVLNDFTSKKDFATTGKGEVFTARATQIDTNKILLVYPDYKAETGTYQGIATVASFSGTTITYGSETVFTTTDWTYQSVTSFYYYFYGSKLSVGKLDTNKAIIVYPDPTTSYGKAIVASISGTTISFGRESTFYGETFDYAHLTNLTTDKALIAYQDEDEQGCAVIVAANGNNLSFGSSVTFYSNGYLYGFGVGNLDTDKALIAYGDGDNGDGFAVVASVSNLTISLGTVVNFNNSFIEGVSVAKLDTDKALIAYNEGWTSGNAVVASVSGTTISIGSEEIFDDGEPYFIHATQIDTDKALIAYQDYSSPNYDSSGAAIVASISGTTISYGSKETFRPNEETGVFDVLGIDTDKAVLLSINDDSYVGEAIVASVSGTTIALGTAQAINQNTQIDYLSAAKIATDKVILPYSNTSNSYEGQALVASISGDNLSYGVGATFADIAYNISVAQLDTDKALIAYSTDTDEGYAVVASVSGTTISYGTPEFFSSYIIDDNISVTQLDTDKALIVYNSGWTGTTVVASVSGTTISIGSEEYFNYNGPDEISVSKLSTDKALIAYEDSGDGAVVVASVSGTTISIGSEEYFSSESPGSISIANLDTDKALIAYYESYNDNYGYGIGVSVSGDTITLGTATAFDTTTDDVQEISTAKLDTDKALITYINADGDGIALTASVSDLAITFGEESTFSSDYNNNVLASTDLGTDKVFTAFNRFVSTQYYGTASIIEADGTVASNSFYPEDNYYVTTTSDGGQLSVTSWLSFDPPAVSETLNSQTINYSISFDGRTTWKIYDTTGGDAGWRPIARDNSGTWEYNSNSTPGATDITWTSATTNTQFGALDEAFQVTANQLTGYEFNNITTSQWSENGGFLAGTTQTIDFAYGLKTTSKTATPKVSQISFDGVNDSKGILALASEANGNGLAKAIKLAVGSIDALFINPSGDIGIGTTSPTSKLDVAGTVDLRGATGQIGLNVNADGEVGIGTNTQTDKLDVAGTVSLRGAAGQTGLYVNSSGNVGINTINPDYQLDVNGQAYFYNEIGVGTNPNSNIGASITKTGWGNTNVYSIRNYAQIFGYGSGTPQAFGTYNYITTQAIYSGGTPPAGYGTYNYITTANNAFTENGFGNFSSLRSYSGDNVYGNYVQDDSGNSTGGTQYGLYVDLDDTDTTNYSLYIEDGSGISYFGSNVGIGTTDPQMSLDISGDATISGTLSLGPQTLDYAGACGTSNAGKMYYDGDDEKYYYCNGTEWTEMGSGSTGESYWTLNGNNLYPNQTDYNVGIGTTDPSAKFENVGTTTLGSELVGSEDALLVNVGTGFTGNLLKLSVNGTQKLAIDSTGQIITASGTFLSTVADSESAIAYNFDTLIALTAPGAKLLSIKNNGEEKMSLDKDGVLSLYNSSSSISNSSGDITIDAASNNISFASDNLINISDLTMGGDATISGTLSLAPQVQGYAGVCDASSAGKMYYDATQKKYYYCNGTSWTSVSSGESGVLEGTGTTNFLTKWQGSSILTNSVLYETGGNLGIGTTDPQYALDVQNEDHDATIYANYGKFYHIGINSEVDEHRAINNWMSYSSDEPIYGIYNDIELDSWGGTGSIYGIYNDIKANSLSHSYTETGYGNYSILTTYDGNNFYGDYVTSNADSTGGNQYGLYVNLNDPQISGNSIYIASTSLPSYFGSNVGIGTTSPTSELDVVGSIVAGIGSTAANVMITNDIDAAKYAIENTGWGEYGTFMGTQGTDKSKFLIGSFSENSTAFAGMRRVPNNSYGLELGLSYHWTPDHTNMLDSGGSGFYIYDGFITLYGEGKEMARFYEFDNALEIYDGDENQQIELDASGDSWLVGGNVGIGTYTPSMTLDVSGNATVSGTLSLGPQTQAYAGTCNTAATGKMYYDAGKSQYLYCNGTDWTEVGTKAGIIVAWSGAIVDIPAGWVLCDGNNGTPDLRGRFIYGAGGSYAVGATGGEETHTLTIAEMPAHTHNVASQTDSSPDGGTGSLASEDATNLTINDAALSTGGGEAHNNLPPYYALAYIMKTANGADLAEWIPASDPTNTTAGTIVSIDPNNKENVLPSSQPYDSRTAGIITTAPDTIMGLYAPGNVQMALAGRVPVKVSLINGEIKPGDPITSSVILGAGMKATQKGQIVGKAMEALTAENANENCFTPDGQTQRCGTVLAFVNVSWYDPGQETTTAGVNLLSNDPEYNQLRFLDNDLSEGDLVGLGYSQISNDLSMVTDITKVDLTSSQKFSGVISKTINGKGDLLKREFADDYSQISAETRLIFNGNTKVKIASSSLNIQKGDFLAVSSISGMAQKALKPGVVIGKALEDWSPDSGKEKINVLVGLGWHDPDIYLTSTGEFNITNETQTADGYQLKDAAGNVIERVGAFAEIAVAKIKAGIIKTQELVAEKKIVSPLAEITEINSQRISLAEISSSSEDNNLTINLENQDSIESSFGKLIIKGEDGQEVASIDAQGNASFAGILESEGLLVENDATIAGTLYADEIITRHGKFGDLIAATISAVQITQNITNIYEQEEASPSGLMTEEEINNLINEILASAPEYTEQAGLEQDIEILSDSTTGTLANLGSLMIGNSLTIADDSLNTIAGPLYLQSLGLGGIDILAGKIVIDSSGNAVFEEDLTVKGTLAANEITPLENQDLTISLANSPSFEDLLGLGESAPMTESSFGKLLVKGVNNEVVASIDASGSAQFASLGIEADYTATQSGVVMAAYDNWQENGEYSPAIKTNATAGIGVLPTYESEVMIYNPKITDQSLIYITPITNTENKVIYVKAKKAQKSATFDTEGNEITVAQNGWFKVAIDTPISKEIQFNWWIVN